MQQDTLIAEAFPRPTVENKKRDLRTDEMYANIRQRAEAENFELTNEHIAVIDYVLKFYETCEDCRNARELMRKLSKAFTDQGGSKYLYRLFPKGPLTQIHALADLPGLRYQVDKGCGTAY